MAKVTKVETPGKVAPEKTQPAIDWSAYEGATGVEQVRSEDLGLPFLMIIQSNSPELKKTSPKFIAGAAVGDVINTVTREVVYREGDEPIIVVPCAYDRLYVEWKTRESGGGLVRSHRDAAILTDCKRNEKGQDVLPNGNLVVNTAYFFLLRLTDGGPEKAVIGLSSTQLKKSRAWLNMALSRKAGSKVLPLFSHTYALSTVHEQNAQGDWYGWKIELGAPVSDPALVSTGADIARQITSQAKKLLTEGGEDAAQY